MRRIRASGGVWPMRGSRCANGRLTARPGRWTRPMLAALLADGKVRLVCFPHCSNVIAEINDVAAICAMARGGGGADGGGRRLLCAARLSRYSGAGVRCLSVFGLQDLWPASGDHGPARGFRVRVAGAGALFQPWHACTSATRPPGRIMPRSRPAPGWRIMSMRWRRIMGLPAMRLARNRGRA